MTPPALQHDRALDGLRAIAVAAVILSHVSGSAFPGGWAGVDIFFVLSGFLIGGILLSEQDRFGRIDVKAFYMRRALRLFPALALLLVCALALAAIRGRLQVAGPALLCAATYTMNWCRALGWTSEWSLGHTWSLAIEEQFYLIFPVLLIVMGGRRRLVPFLWTLLAVEIAWRTALIATGASSARTYNGLDTHADGLIIGVLMAAASLRPTGSEGRTNLLSGGALAILLLMLFTVDFQSFFGRNFGTVTASLCGAVLIYSARQPGILRAVLQRPTLVYVGKISYGIYLWHLLLLFAFGFSGVARLIPVAAAVGIAALSYRFVEAPILKLKSRWMPKGDRAATPGGLQAGTFTKVR